MTVLKNTLLKIGIPVLIVLFAVLMQSCSTFKYRTYTITDTTVEDPEPNYELTLDPAFQGYTSYMFLGNRTENFGTYFNTFFNAKENFSDGYDIYTNQLLSNYSNSIDSVYINPRLSQEGMDDFNKAIEKASKVIQYHKSSAFMDKAVMLIGESYYYLGDYLKAERKFSEFISKLSASPLLEEAILYYARTESRLKDYTDALDRFDKLINTSKDELIISGAYQSMAEYYISIKDYSSAISSYEKSIQHSKDNEFKAQMQFLIATLVARTDPGKGAAEFDKVRDYSTTYELEYLSRFNNLKYLISSNNFTNVEEQLEKLKVKYKDNSVYVSDIELLQAKYYEEKKDYKNAIDHYKYVIMTYGRTPASSDACYSMGVYNENILGDYLTAYKYFKLSGEESSAGHYYQPATSRMKVFKTYFELRSIITGSQINIDNDTTFINYQRDNNSKNPQEQEQKDQEKKGKGDGGRPGGDPIFVDSVGNLPEEGSIQKLKKPLDTLLNKPQDTLKMKKDTLTQSMTPEDSARAKEDSARVKVENITKAKFELAELFIYAMRKQDSAIQYLNDAYEQSKDHEFKAKVLFALASLYRSNNDEAGSDQIFRKIINEYPLSSVANASRRILNLPVEDENLMTGSVDSMYLDAESRFVSKEYIPALQEFENIVTNFSSSKYFARANYAAGWIYENVLNKPDSAYFYYSNIIQLAPKSQLVQQVSGKILEYQKFIASKNDTLKPETDSLQTKKDTLSMTDTTNAKQQEIKNDKTPTGNEGNVNDITNPPGSPDIENMKKESEPKGEPVQKK
jgi:tetratricopeptide (TPR) repeat protein